MSAPVSPWTGWINWSLVLLFGPLAAFVLAEPCGFQATRETFQMILLGEIALVCSGVMALVLARALGPLSERDVPAHPSVRCSAPPAGSAWEESVLRPAAWNARIQTYLQGVRREFAPPDEPEPRRATATDWLTAPLIGSPGAVVAAESSPGLPGGGLTSAGDHPPVTGRRSPPVERFRSEATPERGATRRRRPPSSGRLR
jgi:hypothetical protein